MQSHILGNQWIRGQVPAGPREQGDTEDDLVYYFWPLVIYVYYEYYSPKINNIFFLMSEYLYYMETFGFSDIL